MDVTDANEYLDYPKLDMLSLEDREKRIIDLWHRAFKKARGASTLLN